MKSSTALLTDRYELTMLEAAMGSGTAFRRAVFELFPRRLPDGRRYGVLAGVGRMLDAVEAFRFGDAELGFLTANKVVSDEVAHWLSSYRFCGDMWGFAEGEVYFPNEPLLIVEATFAEACLLETLLLSVYNYDSAVAAAASRMTAMAGDRPCIEMGSRRTNEIAAVAADLAAYLAGFGATSNLEAGRRYGVPTRGTAAHSFTLLHATEAEAFGAQIEALVPGIAVALIVARIGVELLTKAERHHHRPFDRPQQSLAHPSPCTNRFTCQSTPSRQASRSTYSRILNRPPPTGCTP